MLSNNTALPMLPVWQARSFWLQIITVAVVVCNAMGVDLMAVTSGMGLGATPDAVITTGSNAVGWAQQLLALGLGIWAWVERRAPHYRLVWPWSRPVDASQSDIAPGDPT